MTRTAVAAGPAGDLAGLVEEYVDKINAAPRPAPPPG